MRVLVAMSGGVDSSVAAALALDAGHEVVGVTLKLWGGATDRGCCSVADVDDARRAADHLGIDHHVFNFAGEFEDRVVAPYVAAHEAGRTPNPCIECNRHLKFDRLMERARRLGFDALATGHHARVVVRSDGTHRVARGADRAKDQSYVLYMLGQEALVRILLPVGRLTKADVRAEAARRGLRTAAKPDSQDVCFVTAGGRADFLGQRLPLRPGRVVDGAGRTVGHVPALQLVTIGQRRGLGTSGSAPRYVIGVDAAAGQVVVGGADELVVDEVELTDVQWADRPVRGALRGQCSAHGPAHPGWLSEGSPGGDGTVRLRWDRPQRRVAPGQFVVFYQGEEVLGGGVSR